MMNNFFSGDPATFWPAFAKAQGEFPKLTFDKAVDAGQKKYKYATLPAVFEAVRDTLNACGFAVFHIVEGTGVRAIIAGNGGALQSGVCDLGAPGITAQVAGSAMTYARRYTLIALCGIAPEEDDDAGNANQHPVNAAAAPQKKEKVFISEERAYELLKQKGYPKINGNNAGWEAPDKWEVIDLTKTTTPTDFAPTA